MPTEELVESLWNVVTTAQIKTDLLKEINLLKVELSRTIPFDNENMQISYPILCKVLQNQGVILNNKISQSFLDALDNQVRDINELYVHVPAAVAQDMEKLENELVSWAKTNVNPNVIVNPSSSNNITAGITCSYRGIYKDLSLDKVLKARIYDQV